MKKIIFLLAFFSFLLAQKSFAQPTYCFSPQQIEVDEDQTVCLDLKVQDFTQLLSIQFTVTFDPSVLQFQGPVQNLNPMVAGLDVMDFGTTTANLGYITFIWSNGQPCQSATSGETLPDDATLFTLCFKAIGDYGFHTPVKITSSPIDRITRRITANCLDIGEFICDGYVSIGTSPLKINIGSTDGFNGDVVCVDFKVEDFNSLVSAQYYVYWDTSILELFSYLPMNLPPAANYQVYGTQASGKLTSTWFAQNIITGYSVPDGTQILQMCFEIKGICGQSSPIYIDNDYTDPDHPNPIEIIDAVTGGNPDGVNIGLLVNPGQVSVNCNNPNSIGINMADKDVCPGESFFVDVKVSNFSQIVKMMFNLKWNPGVIQLDSVSYPPQAGGPACLPFSTGVNTSQAPNGILEMDWETQSQGCTKPNNYTIMRLHFMAVGPSGANSTIAVTNPIFVDKFGGLAVNIGINNNNSLVTLCQLSQPTIVAESVNTTPGATVCVDFTVQDFNDITSMGYTLAWNESELQFLGVQDFNLTNLSLANFDVTQAVNLGIIGFDWSNPTGVTVPDGISIFTLCFEVLGDPGSCSNILFDDVPWPIVVESETSNVGNIGLNGQPGQICILDPFVLNLSLPDVYSGQNSTVCVDLTAENFNQLTNTAYTIFWNIDILTFDELIPTGALPNFGVNSYDISDADDGYLNIDWAAANQILGTSVADGTSLFQLCFNVIGDTVNQCSPLTIGSYPADSAIITSASTGSAYLNMSTNAGSICVSGTINLVSYVVTDVSCGNNPNGAINITVEGGSGQYAYQWSGPGVNATVEDQTNLNIGNFTVTITDVQNPSLEIIQPFNVAYTPNATYANAGQDTTRSCGTGFQTMTLNGSGSSAGQYFWVALPGFGQVLPGEATKINPETIGTGCFKLTVTGPGCVDTDTVCVAGTQTPIPHVDSLPALLSCKIDTVLLDGTLSPFGYDILWTGPALVPGTEGYLTPKVTAPGMYILTLSNPATGCMGMDTVEVFSDMQLPVSDAGPNDVLGCSDAFVPLGGPLTSMGSEFIYDWVPVGPGQICGNPQAATINACSPGTFQLTVLDTLNGCSAMSEVVITGDTLKPTSDAGPDMALDCIVDMVTLDGSGSSSGGNYDYTWTRLPSTMVAQGSLTPTVTVAGTYQLEVMNNDNGCNAFSEVVVFDSSQTPTIAVLPSDPITCAVNISTLDGTGSATGPSITYAWSNSAGTAIGDSLIVTVTVPDTYLLVVTNGANHCTDTMSVVVEDLTTPPTSEAGPNAEIDCNGDPMLSGSYDSTNADLQIQWQHPGANCIQDGNTTTPTVSCPGTYTLVVVNTATGCTGTDQTIVTPDTLPPMANAGPDLELPCIGSSLQLQGSTDATNFTVQWFPIPSNLPMVNIGTLSPTVTLPGSYSLIVQNEDNGCSSSPDQMVVALGANNLAAVIGAAYLTTNCQDTTVTLDASGSTLTGNTVRWQLLDGTFLSNEVTIEVPAGTYELVITGPGGVCQARDTVVVNDISTQINAQAAVSGAISCDNPSVALDGTGSTTGSGIIYVWTIGAVIAGNGIIDSVSSPGTYILTVTNSTNFCTGTASVQVLQDISGVPANAQADYADCEPEALLIGNLPASTTGVWTTTTGATIADPTNATTTASDLSPGENTFIWTLSLGDCLNYSSGTVSFTVDQAAPNAVNDNTALQPGTGGQVTINVLENDVFAVGNIDFILLPNSVFGEVVANDSGDVVFLKEKCFAGKVEIPYQICNATCPDLCDEANLTIEVQPDPADACDDIPNGITPNGDGVNDELVFDVLLNNIEEYPDNEIVIFNRWGDEVYHAKPYNNDWAGTNQGGGDLPHATYYYILRLNIANGDILRGDVTIIK